MKDKGSMAGWLSLARSLSYLGGGIEMMNNNVHYSQLRGKGKVRDVG